MKTRLHSRTSQEDLADIKMQHWPAYIVSDEEVNGCTKKHI
jgi:hypothetical protein